MFIGSITHTSCMCLQLPLHGLSNVFLHGGLCFGDGIVDLATSDRIDGSASITIKTVRVIESPDQSEGGV